jgi:hypothetical protein
MRIHADDYLTHARPPSSTLSLAGRGGHRYFEQGKPLLSLSSPSVAASGTRRPDLSHTINVGSRKESDEPDAWTEPRQAPVLTQVNK